MIIHLFLKGRKREKDEKKRNKEDERDVLSGRGMDKQMEKETGEEIEIERKDRDINRGKRRLKMMRGREVLS